MHSFVEQTETGRDSEVRQTAVVDLPMIREARTRIKDYVKYTPCIHAQHLSGITNCEVHLKLENLQMTGAYKQRGAFNKMLCLTEQERSQGVITSSAGNHAQGVAYAAQVLDLSATIVMPELTPFSKVQGTARFGANIVLHGKNYEEAHAKAEEIQRENGMQYIHAFDDPLVIAGQGTIGLELIEQNPYLEVVILPIGGGGLAAGVATAIKNINPKIRLIGVEPELIPSMSTSLKHQQVTNIPFRPTIAEGIAVTKVGQNTYSLVKEYLDEVITVSEEEIANAIMLMLEKEKTLSEGAGAAGFAAAYHHKVQGLEGKQVAIIISGGNIDMTMLSRILERGLAKAGRIASFKVILPDRPGTLAELSTLTAREHANILQIVHERSFSVSTGIGEAEVKLTIETKGHDHVRQIIHSLNDQGFAVKQES